MLWASSKMGQSMQMCKKGSPFLAYPLYYMAINIRLRPDKELEEVYKKG